MNRSATSSDPGPATEIDLSWRMRDREARTLAQMMRASRFSLLQAEPGVGRTGLLTGGLLPLLRRRASDAVGEEDRESRVVIPFSDRRSRRAGRSSTRIAERAVLFDGWGADPMAALRAAIIASLPADAATYARSAELAPMLGELSRRFDAQFLIILDSFERFWDPALTPEMADAFTEQLSDAIGLKGLRANFLLSIDALTDARLEGLRQRIDGFEESVLQLLGWDSQVVLAAAPPTTVLSAGAPENALPMSPSAATALPASTTTPATVVLPSRPRLAQAATAPAIAPAPKARVRRPKLPRVPVARPEPIRAESVYAFIESTLTQTASDFAPWQDGEEAVPPPDAALPAASVPAAPAPAASPRLPKPARAATGLPAARQRPVAAEPIGKPASGPAPVEGEATGPVDKWLRPVVAWSRRLLRKP